MDFKIFQNKKYSKYIILMCSILVFNVIIPLISIIFGKNTSTLILSNLGNFILLSFIIFTFLEIIAIFKNKNIPVILSIQLSLSISLFILMETLFIFDYFHILYVWNNSNSQLPIIYKIVAIWAGEEGSILIWLFFSTIIIYAYQNNKILKNEIIKYTTIISKLILGILAIVLLYLNPFKLEIPFIFPNGRGLSEILQTPFMIWHPFFIFIAYSVFLIPFSTTITTIIKSNLKTDKFTKLYTEFMLKFGWFILTLAIGLGVYWASESTGWGRFWGWDPVETVSLIPWVFSTSYFHTKGFKKEDRKITKINVILIYISIIFSTLLTRGGGLASLHTFTGGVNLVFWVVLFGIIIILLTLMLLNDLISRIIESYRNGRLFLDYLSYIFLQLIGLVLILGLIITPTTQLISLFTNFDVIFIEPNYFSTGLLIPAIGLAISLIFCTLYDISNLRKVIFLVIILFLIHYILSTMVYVLMEVWINPFIVFYELALITGVFSLIKYIKIKDFKRFFRKNGKTLIHIGISFILIGTLLDNKIIVFIFYLIGFLIMVLTIIPSIYISIQKIRKLNQNNQ